MDQCKKNLNFRDYSIGIIGGAGPMAGVLLFKKIITRCQKKYNCVQDKDFPKIILLNVPFAQMLKQNTKYQNELMVPEQLLGGIKFLNNSGVDRIIIACNTLHFFLDHENNSNKILNLVQVTDKYLSTCLDKKNKTFIYCTSLTANSKLYKNPNVVQNCRYQKDIDAIIMSILYGKYSENDTGTLIKIFLKSIKENPEISSLLLGCTEFSVLNADFSFLKKLEQIQNNSIQFNIRKKIQVIDPLDIVVSKLFEDMCR